LAELLVVFVSTIITLAITQDVTASRLFVSVQLGEAILHTQRVFFYYFLIAGYMLISLGVTLTMRHYRSDMRPIFWASAPFLVFLIHSCTLIAITSPVGFAFIFKPDIYSVSWWSLLAFNALLGPLFYRQARRRAHGVTAPI
jgi:hypothetical protein